MKLVERVLDQSPSSTTINNMVKNVTHDQITTVSTIAGNMGGEEFLKARKELWGKLTDKSKSFLARRSKKRIDSMISNMNSDKAENSRERRTGYAIAPRLLGLIPYSDLRKALHMECLHKELLARFCSYTSTEKWTTKLDRLKEQELNRLQEENPKLDRKKLDKKYFKKISEEALFDFDV